MEKIYFAIPSYSRAECLMNKTFPLLYTKLNIATSNITVFVVSEELAEYQAALRDYPEVAIKVGPLGLHHMRNHIRRYYPTGTTLIQIDDDVEAFFHMQEDAAIADKKSAKRYPLLPMDAATFHETMLGAFQELHDKQLHLFGIYPVKNGYFMKDLPERTTDLRFCVGAFWGCINQPCETLMLHLEEKEDVERTLRYYMQDHGVLRLNRMVLKTRYYKTQGGMQARPYDRIETSKASCQYLLATFPQACKLYTSKKSGIYEIRLIAAAPAPMRNPEIV